MQKIDRTKSMLDTFNFVILYSQCTEVHTRCLKITEKVAFNITSEVSYVYILSGQKFIKKAKNGPFWRVFEKPEVCGQNSVTRQVTFNWTKIGGKCQKFENFKCDIFDNFQTL